METPNFFSKLILNSIELLNQKEMVNEAIKPLLSAVEKNPKTRGAADALATVMSAHYNYQNAHFGEIVCLLVYRLRATLIDRNQLFNSLVNLTVFTLQQKSFEESYLYGQIAERIWSHDPDLLANMVFACAMTDRGQEALERFEQVKEKDPIKAGELESYFHLDSAHVYRTRDHDCSSFLHKLNDILISIREKSIESMQSLDIGEQIGSVLIDFEQYSDGINSYDCWYCLCELYDIILRSARSEFMILQSWAGLAAASGKALNTRSHEHDVDIKLWRWYGRALSKMCLYELAIEPLRQATLSEQSLKQDQEELKHCEKMLLLDEFDHKRPDSPTAMESLDYHNPRTTKHPSNATKMCYSPDEMMSDAVRIIKNPYGFWVSYNLFDRAFHEMQRFYHKNIELDQELNNTAYQLVAENRLDEAILLLCKAVALVPADIHSWQELAVIRFKQERYADSEEFQERAIEMAQGYTDLPEIGRFWMNMANCRLQRARFDQTLSPIDRQKKLERAYDDAKYAISMGYYKRKTVLLEITNELHKYGHKYGIVRNSSSGCMLLSSIIFLFYSVAFYYCYFYIL